MGRAERNAGLHGTNSVGLTVYFKHRRFVGYSYGPPWGDGNTPLVRQGVMLLTSRGLGLDELVARAQQLYGRAFVVTTEPQGTPPNPRLQRLPAWHVSTPRGALYAGIDSPPDHALTTREPSDQSAPAQYPTHHAADVERRARLRALEASFALEVRLGPR